MSTHLPANDEAVGPDLGPSVSPPHLHESATPCEVDIADTAAGDGAQSSDRAILDSQGSPTVRDTAEQLSLGARAQPTAVESPTPGHTPSTPEPALSPVPTAEEGPRHLSSTPLQADLLKGGPTSDLTAQSQTPLHDAWVASKRPGQYRHVLTGAIYYNKRWKAPRFSGPTAQDIPEGWKARLLDSHEESWSYEHIATGISHGKPASLPKHVLENFGVATKYGKIPDYCQALLLEDGRIAYAPGRYRSSMPAVWYTLEHPEFLKSKIKAYLNNYEIRSGTAEAVMFTGSQSRPVSIEDLDLSKLSGTLLVKDMDNGWIKRLAQEGRADMLHFLVLHILGHKLDKSAIEADTMIQVEAMTRLLQIPLENNGHCHVFYDELSHVLQFWDPSSVMGMRLVNSQTVRISTLCCNNHLLLVLMSNIHGTRDAEPTDINYKDATCWAGAHLQRRDQPLFDFQQTLFRLLGALAEFRWLYGWEHYYLRGTGVTTDTSTRASRCAMLPWLLAAFAWKDNFWHLSAELDYWKTKAAIGPSTDDFSWLNTCRRASQKFSDDLKDYVEQLHSGLRRSQVHSRRVQGENDKFLEARITLLQEQLADTKREFTDTFQLLLGSSAVRDAETQKVLARESKVQAKRAMALTALAAVYLPLSLATGVFGMNISAIDGGIPKYWAVLALGLGLLVASLPFLLWVFLDDDDKQPLGGRPSFSHDNNGIPVPEAGREKIALPEDETRRLLAATPAFLRRRAPGLLRRTKLTSNGSREEASSQATQPGQLV